MKPVHLLCALFILFLSSSPIVAQDFSTPENYAFKTKDDFTKYEPQIIEYTKYIVVAPVNDGSENRKAANAFFMKWLTGAPNVSVEIQPYVMDLTSENKTFLLLFMGGWTRYALEHPGKTDKLQCHIAGVESILKAYKGGNGVEEDEAVANLVDLDKSGKLADWVALQIGTK
jgi:hypothetical protein